MSLNQRFSDISMNDNILLDTDDVIIPMIDDKTYDYDDSTDMYDDDHRIVPNAPQRNQRPVQFTIPEDSKVIRNLEQSFAQIDNKATVD